MDAPVSGYYLAKRGLDCVAGAAARRRRRPGRRSPAMLLVRLTSRGPAIYTQTRVGYGGREFTIYKIRTMIHDCESLTGPRWCVPGDPRVTPVGRVLPQAAHRRIAATAATCCGRDEPGRPAAGAAGVRRQAGPRDPALPGRHAGLPGITGLAQLQLPPDTEVADVERKLAYDLYYARTSGLWLDLRHPGLHGAEAARPAGGRDPRRRSRRDDGRPSDADVPDARVAADAA